MLCAAPRDILGGRAGMRRHPQAFDVGGVIFCEQRLQPALAAEIVVKVGLVTPDSSRSPARRWHRSRKGEQDQRVLKNSLTVVHTPTIPYGIVFCQDLGKERSKLAGGHLSAKLVAMTFYC